ncbi:MAG: enoyl-CoA hydratase/isomerase family protein [Caldilineaceae bacterium]|nr:enoyl-CoA hydratase/isomerase family protein [Caldilineaceae bacterium]MCB0121991.1 enoyl-CoA hydratase/isomerase family protein [Caldilineaceae bacterium]
MQTNIHYRRQKDTVTLTFSAEQEGKPPTLDLDVLSRLEDILERIQEDMDDLRAVVIRSNSEKYFIVGANIDALADLDAQSIVPWVQRGHAVFNQVAEFPLPVIAWVEGYALGGGLELALACDLILATDNARLGQPEAKLGLVSGWGGSHRLPRRVGLAKAKEMFFTGHILDARAAYDFGLVDYVGIREAVQKYLDNVLDGIRECSPFAVAQMKLLLDDSLDTTIDENSLAEASASYRCMEDATTQARIAAFLKKS